MQNKAAMPKGVPVNKNSCVPCVMVCEGTKARKMYVLDIGDPQHRDIDSDAATQLFSLISNDELKAGIFSPFMSSIWMRDRACENRR